MAKLSFLLAFVFIATTKHGMAKKSKCEPVTIPLCKANPKEDFYNMTKFPNSLGHRNQEEAGLEVHQFSPLVKVNCSPHLKMFLCSIYTPICDEALPTLVPPCRELCQQSRSGCEPLMKKFGFNWPLHLDCKKFPKIGDGLLCIGRGKSCTSCVDTSSESLKKLCKDSNFAFVGKVVDTKKTNRIKFKIENKLKMSDKLSRKIRRKRKLVIRVELPKNLCEKDCKKFEKGKKYIVFLNQESGKRFHYRQAGAIPYENQKNIC